MARKFLTPIDLNKLELQNVALQNLSSDPGTPATGQIYFNTGGTVKVYNGSAWLSLSTTSGTVTSVTGTSPVVSSGGTTPAISLASGYGDTLNPYATKTNNYVLAGAASGGSTAPTFRALDKADIPSTLNATTFGGNISLGSTTGSNGYNITGLNNPINAYDAVNKSYVDQVATGINAHEAVAYASTTNISGTYNNGTAGVGATLTGTGSIVIDGYTVVSGDAGTNVSISNSTGLRLLLKDQTLTDQNGIYAVTACVSGTSWTLTRAYDYDALGEVAAGDFTYILNGNANGKFTWIQVSKPAAISGVGTLANAISFSILSNGNISGTVAVNQGGTGATTLTGVLKGNGTSAFTAAVAGTDYIAPYGSTTANTFLAAPNGTAGTPTFRAVVYADLPTNVGVVARKVSLVGTGTGQTIALTHGLGTNLVTAQVYDTSTSTATLVDTDITVTSTVATATFASASTTLSNYTLVVIG
jgi:hypothetical protein